jgi:hypothetical protein
METNTMDKQNLPTEDKKTPEQEKEEKRRKEKEFIRQINLLSKIYPPIDWRELRW